MKNIFAVLRVLVLSLCLLCTAPAKSEAQSYGSVSQYWEFACGAGFSTNIIDNILEIFGLIGEVNGFAIDLDTLFKFDFNVFNMQGCTLPNINFGGLPQIQIDGLFSCFARLPDLSGQFSNMLNCVQGVMANFEGLRNVLQGVDLTGAFQCAIDFSAPTLPTLSAGDLFASLFDKIQAIIELINSMSFQLNDLKKLIGWNLQICETFQAGGGVGAAMAGASVASSASSGSNGTTVNVTLNQSPVGSGTSGAQSGATVSAASVAADSAFLVVSSLKKIRLKDVKGPKAKKGIYFKLFPMKRLSSQRYTVNLPVLPKGKFRTKFYRQGKSGVVFVPGPDIN